MNEPSQEDSGALRTTAAGFRYIIGKNIDITLGVADGRRGLSLIHSYEDGKADREEESGVGLKRCWLSGITVLSPSTHLGLQWNIQSFGYSLPRRGAAEDMRHRGTLRSLNGHCALMEYFSYFVECRVRPCEAIPSGSIGGAQSSERKLFDRALRLG